MSRSVAIVGAGPAGMAAAIEAVARGARVTLIDEAALPGGQIYRQAHPSLPGADFADAGESARKAELLRRFRAAAEAIDYRPGTAAYALFGNGELHVAAGAATEVLRPDAVVLATGVREVAVPFPGWTTPGVMFAGGAQALLKAQRVPPGREAVVAGCGPLPLVVAAQLARAGVAVKALALLRPLRQMAADPAALWQGRRLVFEGMRYGRSLRQAGVPRLTGHVPVRALGEDRLTGVVLARVDAEGRPVRGSEHEIACDLLALNYGFAANSELVAMAGARMRRDPIGGWLPEVDEFGRTSLPGVFVAGDGAGLRGALVAEAEGGIVGAAAASGAGDDALRATLGDAFARRRQWAAFQRAVRGTLRVPAGLWSLAADDTVVCRCENVALRDIREAVAGGHRSLNAVKRNVRSGMGWCGGRICLPAIAALAELHGGVPPDAMMTPRPMVRPVTFAALAAQQKARSA
ncbi:MAG TPA: NAD(P)/FAD-dependent oxidoreductase [Stellaceae bacterium]|nr:NAD(P)/FAD-dependent oxidoreductase [Stellaceae bacterium]